MPSLEQLKQGWDWAKLEASSAWGRWCDLLEQEAKLRGWPWNKMTPPTEYGPLCLDVDAPLRYWPKGGSKPSDIADRMWREALVPAKKRFDEHFASRPEELRELKLFRDATKEQKQAGVALYRQGASMEAVKAAMWKAGRLRVAEKGAPPFTPPGMPRRSLPRPRKRRKVHGSFCDNSGETVAGS